MIDDKTSFYPAEISRTRIFSLYKFKKLKQTISICKLTVKTHLNAGVVLKSKRKNRLQ